jgi:hypothetical protein
MMRTRSLFRCGFITLLLLAGAGAPGLAVDRSLHDPAQPRIGINFSHLKDWNPEQAFVNLFVNFREWTSQATDGSGPFNDKRELDLDAMGYVKSLLPDQRAATLFGAGRTGFDKGAYLFLFDGEGDMAFSRCAKVVDQQPGCWRVECDPAADEYILLTLNSVAPGNHPRNMRFIRPGYHDRQDQVFADDWLALWKDFHVYRFLNWMSINGSSLKSWADRAPPGYAFYSTKKGVPYEVLIDLCNLTGAHPWFNMPHQADDDFIRRFAALVKERLKPGLFPYVEYSNETWNGQFPQNWYVGRLGKELGLATDWKAGVYYYGRRSLEVFKIWEEVYGGHERLVRVVQSQAASLPVTQRIFETPGLAEGVDALAVAPYIAMNISDKTPLNTPDKESFVTMTVDQMFDRLMSDMLPNNVFPKRMQANYDFAKARGLPVIAYEGGQSMTILVKDKAYKEAHSGKIVEANRHPRMEELYGSYFKYWREMGGGTFCHYSSCTAYESMAFGAMWAHGQKGVDSPKYRALESYRKSIQAK